MNFIWSLKATVFYTIWFELLRGICGKLALVVVNLADMAQMLAAMDRKKAGKTAPAHGLYLESVFYAE